MLHRIRTEREILAQSARSNIDSHTVAARFAVRRLHTFNLASFVRSSNNFSKTVSAHEQQRLPPRRAQLCCAPVRAVRCSRVARRAARESRAVRARLQQLQIQHRNSSSSEFARCFYATVAAQRCLRKRATQTRRLKLTLATVFL